MSSVIENNFFNKNNFPLTSPSIYCPYLHPLCKQNSPKRCLYSPFPILLPFFLISLCSGFCLHLSADTVLKAPLTSLLLNPSWQCPSPCTNFLLLEYYCSLLGLPVSVTISMILSSLASGPKVLNTMYRPSTTNSYLQLRPLSRLIYLTSYFTVPLGCPTDN